MSVLGKGLFDFQRSHTNTKVEFGASGYWVEMVPEMQPYLAYGSFSARFCRRDKHTKQSAEKAMPQRMYIQLKNSRLTAYRMGIRVKSTAYGSPLPIASMTAVTRNGLTPHRYAPRKYSTSFSTIAGNRMPSA